MEYTLLEVMKKFIDNDQLEHQDANLWYKEFQRKGWLTWVEQEVPVNTLESFYKNYRINYVKIDTEKVADLSKETIKEQIIICPPLQKLYSRPISTLPFKYTVVDGYHRSISKISIQSKTIKALLPKIK